MDMVVLEQVDRQAVDRVLAEWAQLGEPFHPLVFLPEGEKARVADIQAACRQAGVKLGGALFPQLLRDGGLVSQGALMLRLAGAPPPLLLDNVGCEMAVERVRGRLSAYVDEQLREDEAGSLFCIFDALVPNIATHLDGWYLSLADRVHYFGVNAGNERFTPEPCLFDGERFLADAVLLQLLPGYPGACLEHGYPVPERKIVATSAKGNSIVQIDWRPALDVYRDLMQEEYGVAIDRSNFYEHAVHFPFGILRADGEVLVRIPVALGEGGEIVCVGEIPPNAILMLLDARSSADRAAPALAADLARQGGGGGDLLLFYCAGRRLHMGNRVGAELAAVAAQTGARRVAGALSLGEIGTGTTDGYPLFHNATLVAVPWPK